MTADKIVALSLGVVFALSLVNIRALLIDGAARGVRPYLAGWVAISNCVLGVQLISLSQWMSGGMLIACGISNGVNSALIAFYQFRKH